MWNNVHKFYGKFCENFQKFYLQTFIRLDQQLWITIKHNDLETYFKNDGFVRDYLKNIIIHK